MATFLVTRVIPTSGIELLRANGIVKVNPHNRAMRIEELAAEAAKCDGILTMLTDRIDAALLDNCPKLRAVSNYAVGFNNIDIHECTRRGIGVSNTPDVLTSATAEIAFALMLACGRRIIEADRLVRGGAWSGWAPLEQMGMGIVGKCLGIVGAGRIGFRVAQMARGFDMRILYASRHIHTEFDQIGAIRHSLDDLLNQSDFISLHAPLTQETRHMIGAAQFTRMKPTAVLVNTARGPLIDEAALFNALRNNKIYAAGLDVFEHEPTLTAGLSSLENVVLLPHIGSATVETRTKMAEMAANDLLMMVKGKKPMHPVNAEVWADRQ